MVLLVFHDQVLHVQLSLSELQFIHALLHVQVQEGLVLEHGHEVVTDTLEAFFDGSYQKKSDCHLDTMKGRGNEGGEASPPTPFFLSHC